MEAIVALAGSTSPAEFRAQLSGEATYQSLMRLAANRPEIEVASFIAENGDIDQFHPWLAGGQYQ